MSWYEQAWEDALANGWAGPFYEPMTPARAVATIGLFASIVYLLYPSSELDWDWSWVGGQPWMLYCIVAICLLLFLEPWLSELAGRSPRQYGRYHHRRARDRHARRRYDGNQAPSYGSWSAPRRPRHHRRWYHYHETVDEWVSRGSNF